MNLDKFEEDGNTYFHLCISCPVCHDQGRNTERAFWSHYDNNCHGDIYLGDNAFYKCKKCGHSAHVRKWGYNCPSVCLGSRSSSLTWVSGKWERHDHKSI